jgi:hypothetical protein
MLYAQIMSGFLLVIACMIPLALCDLGSCITTVVTSIDYKSLAIDAAEEFPDASIPGILVDFTQCLLNGTVGQCQFQCMLDFNACIGRDPQCIGEQLQVCVNTCIENTNFLNSGCYSSAVDILTKLPMGLGLLVTFYQIFSSCIDMAQVQPGISWAWDAIMSAINAASINFGIALCSSLQAYIPFPICGL